MNATIWTWVILAGLWFACSIGWGVLWVIWRLFWVPKHPRIVDSFELPVVPESFSRLVTEFDPCMPSYRDLPGDE